MRKRRKKEREKDRVEREGNRKRKRIINNENKKEGALNFFQFQKIHNSTKFDALIPKFKMFCFLQDFCLLWLC